MIRAGSTKTDIAPEHYRAICDEIGERLGFVLRPEQNLPPKIAELLNRLALLDCDASSIVPSVLDMSEDLLVRPSERAKMSFGAAQSSGKELAAAI
jgi:hypothetical protein